MVKLTITAVAFAAVSAYAVTVGAGGFGGSIPFEVEKGFNDSFVDIFFGVNYYFI